MKNLVVILLLAAITISGFGCRREKIIYEGKVVASTIYEAETDKSIWKVSDFPLDMIDSLPSIVRVENIKRDTALLSKLIKLRIQPIYFPREYNDCNYLTIFDFEDHSSFIFQMVEQEKMLNGYIITYKK